MIRVVQIFLMTILGFIVVEAQIRVGSDAAPSSSGPKGRINSTVRIGPGFQVWGPKLTDMLQALTPFINAKQFIWFSNKYPNVYNGVGLEATFERSFFRDEARDSVAVAYGASTGNPSDNIDVGYWSFTGTATLEWGMVSVGPSILHESFSPAFSDAQGSGQSSFTTVGVHASLGLHFRQKPDRDLPGTIVFDGNWYPDRYTEVGISGTYYTIGIGFYYRYGTYSDDDRVKIGFGRDEGWRFYIGMPIWTSMD